MYEGLTKRQRQRLERYSRLSKAHDGADPQRSPTQSEKQVISTAHVEGDKPELPQAITQRLGSIVSALKTLLDQIDLSVDERKVLVGILTRYEPEYARAKKAARDARKAKKTAARNQERELKSASAVRRRERESRIKATHKVSGFGRSAGKPLQGGAPGLGKRS